MDQSNPSGESALSLKYPTYFAFVFSTFTLRPKHILNLLKIFIISIMDSMLVIKQVISSANWVNLISEFPILIPWILGFSLMLMAKSSTAMINKYGDIGYPCLTPCWGLNHYEILPLLTTAEEIFLYIVLIKDRNVSPKLNVSRVLSMEHQICKRNNTTQTFNKFLYDQMWYQQLPFMK